MQLPQKWQKAQEVLIKARDGQLHLPEAQQVNKFNIFKDVRYNSAENSMWEMFRFIPFIEHVCKQLTNDPISGQKYFAVPEIRDGKLP